MDRLQEISAEMGSLLSQPSAKTTHREQLETLLAETARHPWSGKKDETTFLRTFLPHIVGPIAAFEEGSLGEAGMDFLETHGLASPARLAYQAARIGLEFVISAGNEGAAIAAELLLMKAGVPIRRTPLGSTVKMVLDAYPRYLSPRHLELLSDQLKGTKSSASWRMALRALKEIANRGPRDLRLSARRALLAAPIPVHEFVSQVKLAVEECPENLPPDTEQRLRDIATNDRRLWLRQRTMGVYLKVRQYYNRAQM